MTTRDVWELFNPHDMAQCSTHCFGEIKGATMWSLGDAIRDGYYVAYKPIILPCISFIFIQIIFFIVILV